VTKRTSFSSPYSVPEVKPSNKKHKADDEERHFSQQVKFKVGLGYG
jgi:hypothetical protein